MSGPNPSESEKSQSQKHSIRCGQAKKSTEITNVVGQNQTRPLKSKRIFTVKEKVTKNNFGNSCNTVKINVSSQSHNISLEKILKSDQVEAVETSSSSSSNA